MDRRLPAPARTEPRRRRAFTLIELVVTIIVMTLLATIGTVSYRSVMHRSQDAAAQATLTSLAREAAALAVLDHLDAAGLPQYQAALDDLPQTDTATAAGLPDSGSSLAAGWTLVENRASQQTTQVSVAFEAATGRQGLALLSASGHCALAQVTNTSLTNTWSAGELGANCTGSTALAGPDANPGFLAAGPDRPTNVTADPANLAAVLRWTASDRAASYQVLRDGVVEPVATSTEPSATVTGLTNGTEYTFRVIALTADGSPSDPSEPVTVTPAISVVVNAANPSSLNVQTEKPVVDLLRAQGMAVRVVADSAVLSGDYTATSALVLRPGSSTAFGGISAAAAALKALPVPVLSLDAGAAQSLGMFSGTTSCSSTTMTVQTSGLALNHPALAGRTGSVPLYTTTSPIPLCGVSKAADATHLGMANYSMMAARQVGTRQVFLAAARPDLLSADGQALLTASAKWVSSAIPADLGPVTLEVKDVSIRASAAPVRFATSYEVQYRPLGSTTWQTTSGAALPVEVAGLNHTSSYELQVRPVNASGAGNWSPMQAVTTMSPRLAPEQAMQVVVTVANPATLHPDREAPLVERLRFRGHQVTVIAHSAAGAHDYTDTDLLVHTVGGGSALVSGGLTAAPVPVLALGSDAAYQPYGVLRSNGAGSNYGNKLDLPASPHPLVGNLSGTVALTMYASQSVGDSFPASWSTSLAAYPLGSTSQLVLRSSPELVLFYGAVTPAFWSGQGASLFTTATEWLGTKATAGAWADTTLTQTSAALSWPVSHRASSYEVRHRPLGAPDWTTFSTNSTSATLTGLESGRSYELGVRALGSAGVSDWSVQYITTPLPVTSTARQVVVAVNSTTFPAQHEKALIATLHARGHTVTSVTYAQLKTYDFATTSTLVLPGNARMRMTNAYGSAAAGDAVLAALPVPIVTMDGDAAARGLKFAAYDAPAPSVSTAQNVGHPVLAGRTGDFRMLLPTAPNGGQVRYLVTLAAGVTPLATNTSPTVAVRDGGSYRQAFIGIGAGEEHLAGDGNSILIAAVEWTSR